MCCPDCLQYPGCRTRIEIHEHKMAQSSMPNPHYHLCHVTATCTFDCRRCGKLTQEMPRLSSAQHFAYGCCHRCSGYQGCDFVGRHRRALEPIAASRGGDEEASQFVEVLPLTTAAASSQNRVDQAPPA